MNTFAPPVQKLVSELSRLPGIGQRTAQRLAFHILRTPPEEALELAEAIREVKARIGLCEICFNLADEPRCRICQDPRRDRSTICVVEEPGDVIPMERTHEYHGVYHVLGGALSPIDGIDPEDLRVAELYARIGTQASAVEPGSAAESAPHDAVPSDQLIGSAMPGPAWGSSSSLSGPESVREVVLATNPTTTGEATALHIAAGLRERAPGLRVTRLASGLPVGADLEYADEVTLGKALAGRRAL